jgi:hypothetical protein
MEIYQNPANQQRLNIKFNLNLYIRMVIRTRHL